MIDLPCSHPQHLDISSTLSSPVHDLWTEDSSKIALIVEDSKFSENVYFIPLQQGAGVVFLRLFEVAAPESLIAHHLDFLTILLPLLLSNFLRLQ